MDHVQRAVVHALGALRCYITLLAAEGERRGLRLLDSLIWVLLLAGAGLVGMFLFGLGLARWLESRLDVPGSGAMIVGIGIIAIFLAVTLARVLGREREK